MHAGIAAAQTWKVPNVLAANRKNKALFVELLKGVQGISFATTPDPAGDSATFLNLLLPDTETAKRTVDEFNAAGIGGFNYWYLNMYHFINQWDHLKNLTAAAPLPIHHYTIPQDYNKLSLPKSQEVIGRLISFGIRCTWAEAEIRTLAAKIRSAVEKAVAEKSYA